MDDDNQFLNKGVNQSLFNSEPQRKLQSILKDRRTVSDDVIGRKDYYGNPIIKGNKGYKIKFKDNNQVYLVENWKQYNTDVTNEEPPCVCQLQ